MQSPPLLRAVGGGSPRTARLVDPVPRLRPGDRPVWVDLRLTGDQVCAWRTRAAECGLSVDVWLGLLLEFQLIRERLIYVGAERVLDVVASTAEWETKHALAPTPELRRWVDQLASPSSSSSNDDLPSVVLGERLLAQLPPSDRADAIMAAAESGSESQSVALDKAAALRGQTMEVFVYLAAIAAG